MSISIPQPIMQQVNARSRSFGLKLLVVCALTFVMGIPALFVNSLVEERTQRESEVKNEISSHVGGPQTFLGPTLAIPYVIPRSTPAGFDVHDVYFVFPQKGDADLATTTEERHRSLFRVPVFRADLRMTGTFDLPGVPANLPPGAQMDWGRAEIVVGVSDARGALADATLTTDANTVTLTPSSVIESWTAPNDSKGPLKLTLFGSRISLPNANGKFTTTANLRFSGAERVAVLAYAKTTHLTAKGDWRNPGFDGGILPLSHSINDHGFTAEWEVPFIARGVRAEGAASDFPTLNSTSLGTSFIEVADPYQSVTRALKYVLLFLGLVFLCYFVFEVTTGKRVHPAQYILIGVAQIIFYLLLLSLAERVGFNVAFLLGGGATVSLLSVNAGWIFASRLQAARAGVVFTLLYIFIYLLLRLEDNALLIGAVASFVVVAAVMYFTRNLDWYSSLTGAGRQPPQSTPTPPTPIPAVRYESLLDPL